MGTELDDATVICGEEHVETSWVAEELLVDAAFVEFMTGAGMMDGTKVVEEVMGNVEEEEVTNCSTVDVLLAVDCGAIATRCCCSIDTGRVMFVIKRGRGVAIPEIWDPTLG